MAEAFPNCRRLGCDLVDMNRAWNAIPRGVPHIDQVPFIRAELADWQQWRALDLALADGIPQPEGL